MPWPPPVTRAVRPWRRKRSRIGLASRTASLMLGSLPAELRLEHRKEEIGDAVHQMVGLGVDAERTCVDRRAAIVGVGFASEHAITVAGRVVHPHGTTTSARLPTRNICTLHCGPS